MTASRVEEYFAEADRLYRQYSHGPDCPLFCRCHREPRLRGQFKVSRYSQFLLALEPHLDELLATVKREGKED